MASVTSHGWELAIEDAPEIDGDLLMSLLEESQVQQEPSEEDERLGCVIRSLESVIDHNAVGGNNIDIGTTPADHHPECEDHHDHWIMDYGLGSTVGSDDGHYCSRSTCQIDDPFDWVDMDMDANSHHHCDEIGNWYVEGCGDHVVDQMVGFADGVLDYSPLCSGDYSSVLEHGYSFSTPLWQEAYDSMMM